MSLYYQYMGDLFAEENEAWKDLRAPLQTELHTA